MDTPGKIKIGPLVYRVWLDDHEDAPLGRHDLCDQTITIHGNAKLGVQLQTLWHEIVHAIKCHFFGDCGPHDEREIQIWGTAIMSVLQDNPLLCEVMMRSAKATNRTRGPR